MLNKKKFKLALKIKYVTQLQILDLQGSYLWHKND
jgi:hypothetical protein